MFRLRFGMAHEVYETFGPARGDVGSDLPDREPLAYLDALAASETPEAALSFCAYLLPRREAVWWGCRSLRGFEEPISLSSTDEALTLAERWVRRPDDALRRTCLARAMESDFEQPSPWMALAVGWAGGSMSLGEHAVPAPTHLTAKAARAGLLLAVARDHPSRRKLNVSRIIGLGRRVASGEETL